MEKTLKNPVTRLIHVGIELSNGEKFSIINDLEPSVSDRLVDKWKRKAKRHTAMSLVYFIKERKPFCICVTKEQYDEATKGKVVHATKEEYDAENN